MNDPQRARVLRLYNMHFTAQGISKEVGVPVEDVRKVLHYERSRRSKVGRHKTPEERAVELLRREGCDEAVIAANFP